MFRSLRSRSILSHVLPILLITPLIGVTLVYVLETRLLLESLADNLLGDARMLAEISRLEYQTWGDPYYYDGLLTRVRLDPDEYVMFMDSGGRLLYSSDPSYSNQYGNTMQFTGMETAFTGDDVQNTDYNSLRVRNISIEVYTPVYTPDNQLQGVVRINYQISSLLNQFTELRFIVLSVVLVGILVGVLLGSALALSITRPVQRVTDAVYDLAVGARTENLPEKGSVEIRDLSRSVNYLVEQLRSLEYARRQLLANLVHELGRPLGALRSAIQALLKGAAHDPQLLADLTSGMDEEVLRMQHILEDLAQLHDQVIGTLELNRSEINLGEWLPGVLRPWEEAAREKQLIWKEHIPEDLPAIRADPLRLAQVIGNIASNAVKYTPAGGEVVTESGVEGEQVWIQISDTGLGIPPEEQDKVFEPFYRGTQQGRIKQGMGLGLSIARTLIEAHGGKIEVQSEPGVGSKFKVWIKRI